MSAGAPTVAAQPPDRSLPSSPQCTPARSAGPARGGAACSVLDTTELRWFVPGPTPPAIRDSLNAWAGCIAGALDESVYLDKIRAATIDELAAVPGMTVKVARQVKEFL